MDGSVVRNAAFAGAGFEREWGGGRGHTSLGSILDSRRRAEDEAIVAGWMFSDGSGYPEIVGGREGRRSAVATGPEFEASMLRERGFHGVGGWAGKRALEVSATFGLVGKSVDV